MARTKKTSTSSASALANYEAIYNDLKPFVNFSFRPKKAGFRPAEKSALTRAWKKYADFSMGVDRGYYAFSKAKPTQLRHLKEAHKPLSTDATPKKRKKLESNRVIVTNKGVFVPQGKTAKVFDFKDAPTLKVTGRGKNVKIELSLKTRVEVFIPRHHDETMWECYNRIIFQYPTVTNLYLAVAGRIGLERFDPMAMSRYLPELDALDEAVKRQGYDAEEVFNGFWIIYMKQDPRFL